MNEYWKKSHPKTFVRCFLHEHLHVMQSRAQLYNVREWASDYIESNMRVRVEHTDKARRARIKIQKKIVLFEQRQKTSKLHLANFISCVFISLSVESFTLLDINAFVAYSSIVHCSIKCLSMHEILIVSATIFLQFRIARNKRYFDRAVPRKKNWFFFHLLVIFVCLRKSTIYMHIAIKTEFSE